MIKELDTIVLTQDVPKVHLKTGDVGTVVMVHGEGAAYEVEFSRSTETRSRSSNSMLQPSTR